MSQVWLLDLVMLYDDHGEFGVMLHILFIGDDPRRLFDFYKQNWINKSFSKTVFLRILASTANVNKF